MKRTIAGFTFHFMIVNTTIKYYTYEQNTKEWIQYASAIAMVTSAIGIAFFAFAITANIASGVLVYVA